MTDTQRLRYALFACARWEANHIAEWLTYHAAIGFEHVFLCCNDDDPVELYAAVLPFMAGPRPFVTFMHFPFPGQQRYMYLNLLRRYAHRARYVMFLDIDEFVTIPSGEAIDGLRERLMQDADALYLNWIMFGANGHVTRPQGSVLMNYTRREYWLHPYTKLLIDTERLDLDVFEQTRKAFWHEWPGDAGRCVNAAGRNMGDYYVDFPAVATEYVRQPEVAAEILQAGYISHFALKSEEDFERRLLRGIGGDFSQQVMWSQAKASGRHHAILESHNAVESPLLAEFWTALLAKSATTSLLPKPHASNIAIGKPAMQSSCSTWSIQPTAEGDAAGAVNGRLGDRHQFCTDLDDVPWWQVDLVTPTLVEEVRVFNRLDDGAARARDLSLDASPDGFVWTRWFDNPGKVFGGVDGNPLRWVAPEGAVTRYLRVSLPRRDYLCLNQVEVYGRPDG